MKLLTIKTDGNIDKQIVKITEELGEVIQSIKQGQHTHKTLEEINDVIQATMTLRTMIEPSTIQCCSSWNMHLEKMLVRDAEGKIKIVRMDEL